MLGNFSCLSKIMIRLTGNMVRRRMMMIIIEKKERIDFLGKRLENKEKGGRGYKKKSGESCL
jgi:hypothetical protein